MLNFNVINNLKIDKDIKDEELIPRKFVIPSR
jgi:hypothetical protein